MRSALRAAVLVAAALALSAPDARATTRHPVTGPSRARRLHVARPRFAPAIPPFDPIEAEAEVHEIAPYRTYPYYSYAYRTPYPYPYDPW